MGAGDSDALAGGPGASSSGERHLVAVVTGASRGLGAGMAEALGAAGLSLGLCARSRPRVPDGIDGHSESLDVADPRALERFASAVVDRFGRIDLWINNAGMLEPVGPLTDADPEDIRRNLAVNIHGVVFGTQIFARHVRSRPGGGVLVNISSGAGRRPYAGWAAYGASKAAVDLVTEVVAIEERCSGLRAYAVAPGVVDTAMQAAIRATSPAVFPEVDRFVQLHRSGAFNTPAWVVRFILDLVDRDSDDLDDEGPDGSGRAVLLRVPDQFPAP